MGRSIAIKDLTGMRFGKLLVTSEYERRVEKSGASYLYWKCVCDCGREKWCRGTSLSYGHIQSCGHHKKPIHNMSNTRLYYILNGMKQRCYNKNNEHYSIYGGRGIHVCDEWLGRDGIIRFMSWALHNGYKDDLTIERIDVDGDYCPENCKWIPQKQQLRNQRRTVRTDSGEDITSFAEKNGMNAQVVRNRKSVHGWSDKHLLDAIPKKRFIEYKGKKYTPKELSEITGIKVGTIQGRILRGCTDEEIVMPVNTLNTIPIEQYDLNGNYIATYKCLRDAVEKTGIPMTSITYCANGKIKKTHGYVFKKAEKQDQIRVERCLKRSSDGGWIDNRGKRVKEIFKNEQQG